MESEPSLPTCYRHPDRETRLSCTVCERPVCTECKTSASVGQRCPECAKPSGRSKVIPADEALRGAVTSTPFTKGVIAICVVLFALGFVGLREEIYGFGVQCNTDLAVEVGRLCTGSVSGGEYWRLLTSMFLHSPSFLLHIVFNMLLLYMLGPPIEREVGSWAFASLYLAAGLVGSATFFFFADPAASALGASGAVFGLFGAWLAAGIRNRHTLHGKAMLRQIGPLVLLNLAISFLPGIAWQAHVGGFVAGFAIAFVWWRFREKHTAARLGVGTVVALAAVLSVVTGSGPTG